MPPYPSLLALENLPCQLHSVLPVFNTSFNRDLDSMLEFMASCQTVSRLPLALKCFMFLGTLAVAVLKDMLLAAI